MVKKVLALVGAGAMLLTVAVPALAWPTPPAPNLKIVNSAWVTNNVGSWANTGRNMVSGWCSIVKTGDAQAVSSVGNDVNLNVVGCSCFNCNCGGDLSLTNKATVTNRVGSWANTGSNTVMGGWLTSGNASAVSVVENAVNTNIVGE